MTAAAAPSALDSLKSTLRSVWRFGSVSLVGWTPTGNGIEVLAVPVTRLFEHVHLHRRLLKGDRQMGRKTFDDVAAHLGMQPIEIRLDAAIEPAAIEAAVSLYSFQHTDQRAVFLVDIVGFSLLAPEQQALQIATLEFALNLAGATIAERKGGARFLRSTTGDGFYVWSPDKGLEADLSLLAFVVMTLTFLGCLRRSSAAAGVPALRSCFGIGSHYTYRQPGASGASDTEFIVGQITIELARLIGAAAANQILVGSFSRHEPGEPEAIDTVGFLVRASARMDWLNGLRLLPDARVERCALYLTGPRDAEGIFGALAIVVVDKHGVSHRCFNMKVNVFLSDGEPFYCGLQHDDRLSPSAPDA